jgi:hypothetical protein
VLFAAAASAAAWAAWPQPTADHVAEGKFNAVATVILVVAVLPLLSWRFFGPASPSRFARSLRVLGGAAVLTLVPLGFYNFATNPWLPGSAVDPLVVLAWLLLFGGPAAAAVLAGRRVRGPDGARPPHSHRIRQGVAAGVLANGTAAMFTTTLGTGLTLLTVRSPWALNVVTHGRPMTALATYRYTLNTGQHAGGYLLMLMFFPVIGMMMSYLAAVIANPVPRLPEIRSSGPGLTTTYGE